MQLQLIPMTIYRFLYKKFEISDYNSVWRVEDNKSLEVDGSFWLSQRAKENWLDTFC